jgi:Arc/MetJ-type ribon-helix-helix transcriptional regulator
MKTVSLKLTDELEARLSALAKRRNRSRSELVRSALLLFLSREDEESFAARARDLCGIVDGPRDLASNPRPLAGYGN